MPLDAPRRAHALTRAKLLLGDLRYECGAEILCDVKLRTPSRQFDEQAPDRLQATDQ